MTDLTWNFFFLTDAGTESAPLYGFGTATEASHYADRLTQQSAGPAYQYRRADPATARHVVDLSGLFSGRRA